MNCCQQLIACAHIKYKRLKVILGPDILTAKLFFILYLEIKKGWKYLRSNILLRKHPDAIHTAASATAAIRKPAVCEGEVYRLCPVRSILGVHHLGVRDLHGLYDEKWGLWLVGAFQQFGLFFRCFIRNLKSRFITAPVIFAWEGLQCRLVVGSLLQTNMPPWCEEVAGSHLSMLLVAGHDWGHPSVRGCLQGLCSKQVFCNPFPFLPTPVHILPWMTHILFPSSSNMLWSITFSRRSTSLWPSVRAIILMSLHDTKCD